MTTQARALERALLWLSFVVLGYHALDVMESRLKDHAWFAGDAYSIADIALYAYTHVAHEGGFDLARYSGIRGWLARVASQPGHIRIID